MPVTYPAAPGDATNSACPPRKLLDQVRDALRVKRVAQVASTWVAARQEAAGSVGARSSVNIAPRCHSAILGHRHRSLSCRSQVRKSRGTDFCGRAHQHPAPCSSPWRWPFLSLQIAPGMRIMYFCIYNRDCDNIDGDAGRPDRGRCLRIRSSAPTRETAPRGEVSQSALGSGVSKVGVPTFVNPPGAAAAAIFGTYP